MTETEGQEGMPADPARPARGPRRLWLRRPTRRTAVIAVVLAAGLTGAFVAGRLTVSEGRAAWDLPESAARVVSADNARHVVAGELWPTQGNRRHDRQHAREGLRRWFTTFQGQHFGRLKPNAVESDGGDSYVVFSGTVPNSGWLKAGGGAAPNSHVSVIQLFDYRASEAYLIVYNPGLSPDSVWGDVSSAPARPGMSGPRRDGKTPGSDFGAPVPLYWDDTEPFGASGDRIAMVMPPWLSNLRVAGFGAADSAWRTVRPEGDGTVWVPIYAGVPEPKIEVDETDDRDGEPPPCGGGVLLRADERPPAGGTPQQVTYLYKPGFPYPVKLSYYPTPRAADQKQNDAAALDTPQMRYAAGAFLCDPYDHAVGVTDAPYEITWQSMWEGRPRPEARRMSVVSQDIEYATVKPLDDDRTSVVALGVDDPRDRQMLTHQPTETEPTADRGEHVGCLIEGDRVAVVGPKNTREVRVFDPVGGRALSGPGNFASFPRDALPKNLDQVQAIAVTDDKKNRLQKAPCATQD